jgi:hypothetical protein
MLFISHVTKEILGKQREERIDVLKMLNCHSRSSSEALYKFPSNIMCKQKRDAEKCVSVKLSSFDDVLVWEKLKVREACRSYSPPSSVMTRTVVLGPGPSGLNT